VRLRDQVIGALSLLMRAPGRIDETRLQVGQSLADVATIGLPHEPTCATRKVLAPR
jgi:hypothetical protein